MKPIRIPLAAAALVLGACADASPVSVDAPAAAPLVSAASRGIDGAYIVVLNEGADPRAVAAVAGVSPRHIYTAALVGFSAALNAGQLTALRHNPDVAWVEQDQEVRALAAPWNLDRIDQRNLPLNGTYAPLGSPGTGVYAYVIDTGILTSHTQFGGRAAVAYDALGGNGQDCNGHGTHVAGTIGATTYGVANQVRLRAVRVLNCTGSGTTSAIIAAIDWVRVNRTNPAVANLSLGGGFSSALNTAVNNLASSGVFVSVGAGGENQNACNVSRERGVGHDGGRQHQHGREGELHQLRQLRGHLRAGKQHHQHLAHQHHGHQHHQRHVDGRAARGRDGGALQGHVRQRGHGHHRLVDQEPGDAQRDHRQPHGHAQPPAVRRSVMA
jgi:subtilisin family serine protease